LMSAMESILLFEKSKRKMTEINEIELFWNVSSTNEQSKTKIYVWKGDITTLKTGAVTKVCIFFFISNFIIFFYYFFIFFWLPFLFLCEVLLFGCLFSLCFL
jgi:hypothetical protein